MNRERIPQLINTMSMSTATTVAAAMAAPIKVAKGRLVRLRIVTRHDQSAAEINFNNFKMVITISGAGWISAGIADQQSAEKRLTVDQRL